MCVCVCENELLGATVISVFWYFFFYFYQTVKNGIFTKIFAILPAATRGQPRCLEFCEAHVAVSAMSGATSTPSNKQQNNIENLKMFMFFNFFCRNGTKTVVFFNPRRKFIDVKFQTDSIERFVKLFSY